MDWRGLKYLYNNSFLTFHFHNFCCRRQGFLHKLCHGDSDLAQGRIWDTMYSRTYLSLLDHNSSLKHIKFSNTHSPICLRLPTLLCFLCLTLTTIHRGVPSCTVAFPTEEVCSTVGVIITVALPGTTLLILAAGPVIQRWVTTLLFVILVGPKHQWRRL